MSVLETVADNWQLTEDRELLVEQIRMFRNATRVHGADIADHNDSFTGPGGGGG